MPQAISGGQGMVWQRFGRGPRQVLALHCMLAHSGEWRMLAERLEGRAGLAAPDLPGHGASAPWVAAAGYFETSLTGARALLQGLSAAGPVDLVGHSFGGVVALALALAEPGRLASLTLVEPVLFAALAGTPAGAEEARAAAPFEAALARGETEAAARLFVGRWGAGLPWEALDPRQRQGFVARIPLVVAGGPATLDDRPGTLAPGRLEALDLPVLLLRGARSPACIAAIQSALAARLPRARQAEIAGAGHMLPLSHPEALAAVLGGFLDGLPALSG